MTPERIELDAGTTSPAAAVPLARARPAVRVDPGPAALGVLVACGAVVALAAPATRYLVPAGPGPRVAGWIAGPLAGTGWQLDPPLFCALLATMVLAYFAALRWSAEIPARWALGAILLLHALFLLAPPLGSSDVFNYLDAGRLDALHGLNPYLAAPLAAPRDAAFPFTGAAWASSPTVYGPAFTLLCAALAPLGLALQLWALKALAAGASLACTALARSCARRLGQPPLRAAIFFGLNPIVLVVAVGGAHNDLLASALAMLGIWAATRRRTGPAAATLVGAAAVKLTAGIALPFLLLGAEGARQRRGALVGTLGATAVAAAGSLALFGAAPLHLLGTLGAGSARHVGELRSIPGFLAGYAGVGPIGPAARAALDVVGLAGIGAAVALALRGRLPWLSAACWSVLAVLVSSTRLEPWYAVWLIPLAAVSGDRRVRGASHALLVTIAAIAFARYALRLGIHYPHGG
jgi:hypothetical protein